MTIDILGSIEKALEISDETIAKQLALQRMIPLNGKIDNEKAQGVCRALVGMDMKEVAPITLLINSPGGGLQPAFSIASAIDSIRSPVTGLVLERAASAAVTVLLSCKRRVALPGSTIFVHCVRKSFELVLHGEELTDSELRIMANHAMIGRNRMEQLFVTKLGKPLEEIRELMRLGEKLDIDYTAEEALQLGFIQEIVKDFKYWETPKTPSA